MISNASSIDTQKGTFFPKQVNLLPTLNTIQMT